MRGRHSPAEDGLLGNDLYDEGRVEWTCPRCVRCTRFHRLCRPTRSPAPGTIFCTIAIPGLARVANPRRDARHHHLYIRRRS
jgi:hypothetical protein